jgi:hypothetical protein
MRIHFPKTIATKSIDWLMEDTEPLREEALSDFERIQYEIRRCDVLLIEGRSRVSRVISLVTQSVWSHAALYIGRLYDIKDPKERENIAQYYQGEPDIPLVIESVLGKGVIVSPLTNYQHEHIRICRPTGLSGQDSTEIVRYAISKLGTAYDMQQIFDLWRFLIPWSVLPRRWRSSLFSRKAGDSTRFSCSLLLAEAFSSVSFPILPVMSKNKETGIEFFKRNPRLYTPSDFDYSPFFQIIKYPMVELGAVSPYHNLPWNREGIVSDGEGIFSSPEPHENPDPEVTTEMLEEQEKLEVEQK